MNNKDTHIDFGDFALSADEEERALGFRQEMTTLSKLPAPTSKGTTVKKKPVVQKKGTAVRTDARFKVQW